MTVEASVEGIESLTAKLKALYGSQHTGALLKANQKSAKDFQALVRATAPVDPESRHGHLVDTLAQTEDARSVSVSIGNETHRYPFHLEVGHRARDGSHVPGKAFWFPAIRVLKKRRLGQIVRAENATVKAIIASAGTPPSGTSGD
jgi:hypothetical protein